MRRIAFFLICLASPAWSWEFTAQPICTLRNDGSPVVTVTYDRRLDEPYAISLLSPEPWPDGAVFGLRFEGGRPLTITTPRHRLTDEGRNLTVTDRGFGNVLAGLEFNDMAVAVLGDRAMGFSLNGAAEAVSAFRACISAPVA